VYGWAPRDQSVIGRIVSSMRTTGRVTVHGRGTALRDYVSLDDLCRLLDQLLPLRYHGILNVATGQSRRIIDIVKLVGDVVQLRYETVYADVDPERDFDLTFQTDTLRSLVPAFQFSDIETGIRSYLST
jgi:UDP-glucose 4-epimerase